MKVKMILPALTEATSPFWRPIKYSLFPPLGLATLAGYLDPDDEVEIQDEHVERLDLDDAPDLVVIQVYITSAYRAYRLADHYRRRGAYVALGGLHVTSLPDEAARARRHDLPRPRRGHLAAVPRRLPAGQPPRASIDPTLRTLAGLPPIRRDLIKRHLYLVPNSIVVSRGCPHVCDFCYKEAFFEGGRSFYTQTVDEALAEIERLPGRHLYFLDDHLFGDPPLRRRRCSTACAAWAACGRPPARCNAVLRAGPARAGRRRPGCAACSSASRRSTPRTSPSSTSTRTCGRDYGAAIRRLHDLGVMINGSFVFGMDDDDESVFERTVEWAIEQGIETATFHILTPYPGHRAPPTAWTQQGRITSANWDLYDTRHVVFRPARMTAAQLEQGYWRAYREFYRWRSIAARRARRTRTRRRALRHLAYAAGWKKFEPLWDLVIRAKRAGTMLPVLETILSEFGRRPSAPSGVVDQTATQYSPIPTAAHEHTRENDAVGGQALPRRPARDQADDGREAHHGRRPCPRQTR